MEFKINYRAGGTPESKCMLNVFANWERYLILTGVRNKKGPCKLYRQTSPTVIRDSFIPRQIILKDFH